MSLIEKDGVFIADTARVLGDVRLARNVSIWYGAVVRGDMAPITIGEATNIQDNCVLHCDPGEDLVIGAHVTVGHMATVHGQKIGDYCLIGIGSIILARAEIGENCLIAAGALIREGQKVPANSIVVGVPGKVIGQNPENWASMARDRAMRYAATARRHVDGKVDPKYMKEHGK